MGLGGCATGEIRPIVVPPAPAPVPTRIDGAATAGQALEATTVEGADSPVELSLLGGELFVAESTRALRVPGRGVTATLIPVGAPGEPASMGALSAVARRGGGVWLLSSEGLFHDRDGRLLKSPVSDDLRTLGVKRVNAFGQGAQEALWAVTAGDVRYLVGGEMFSVSLHLEGAPSTASFAVGVGPGQALVVLGETAVFVDVSAAKAHQAIEYLGQVHAVERDDDGSVVFATSNGLFTWHTDGRVTWHTLVASGDAPRAVNALSVGGGPLAAVSGCDVLERSGGEFKSVATLVASRSFGLRRDATGTLFAVDGARLVRLALHEGSGGISFATDVKPIVEAGCGSCHDTAREGAPLFNFGNFETVKSLAARSLVLMKGLDPQGKVMPPFPNPSLADAQIQVFEQWIAGGYQP